MNNLEHQPRTTAEHRERYPRALARRYTMADALAGKGVARDSVFDWDDGLRLIVSREWHVDHEELHLSASIDAGSRLYERFAARPETDQRQALDDFMRLALARFHEITDDRPALEFHNLDGRGAPHWYARTAEGKP